MTQEFQELRLQDLSTRMPYGVKVKIKYYEGVWNIYSINPNGDILVTNYIDQPIETNLENCKPYLFPLSSMTDELWDKEFREYGISEFTRDSFKYGCEILAFNNEPNLSNLVKFVNQLLKNHFDIYGLIPKGLAIDATYLNIY